MGERPVFPNVPINGRTRHAHHYDGTHGCADHLHIEAHREECVHEHEGVGHPINIDSECGLVATVLIGGIYPAVIAFVWIVVVLMVIVYREARP